MDRFVDIRFLDDTTIDFTSDGEEFEEEFFQAGEELKDITLMDEGDNVFMIQCGDGTVGTVSGEAFEVIKEYD